MTLLEQLEWTCTICLVVRVVEYAFMDRPTLLGSAAERSALKGYYKLLVSKHASSEVNGVNDNTLQMLQ